MLLASFAVAVNGLLFKFVAIDTSFWTASFWEYIGFMIALIPLFMIRSYRRDFLRVLKVNREFVIGVNGLNEVINIIAKIAMNYATLLAPLTLAWVVNGFQPFFVLVYGLILTIFLPGIIKEEINKKVIIQKVLFSLTMLVSVYMLVV